MGGETPESGRLLLSGCFTTHTVKRWLPKCKVWIHVSVKMSTDDGKEQVTASRELSETKDIRRERDTSIEMKVRKKDRCEN